MDPTKKEVKATAKRQRISRNFVQENIRRCGKLLSGSTSHDAILPNKTDEQKFEAASCSMMTKEEVCEDDKNLDNGPCFPMMAAISTKSHNVFQDSQHIGKKLKVANKKDLDTEIKIKTDEFNKVRNEIAVLDAILSCQAKAMTTCLADFLKESSKLDAEYVNGTNAALLNEDTSFNILEYFSTKFISEMKIIQKHHLKRQELGEKMKLDQELKLSLNKKADVLKNDLEALRAVNAGPTKGQRKNMKKRVKRKQQRTEAYRQPT